jgi:hypothetical protein
MGKAEKDAMAVNEQGFNILKYKFGAESLRRRPGFDARTIQQSG